MFHEQDGVTSYWGVSDLREEREFSVRLRRFSNRGELLGEKEVSGALPPNTATRILERLPLELVISDPSREFLHAELVAGDLLSERFYHLGHRRDWQLPLTDVETKVHRTDLDRIVVRIEARGYAHFVSATVADPLARYSDNFVDILPGEAREIVIRTRQAGPITIRGANTGTTRISGQ
jgi:beta-mannosidase